MCDRENINHIKNIKFSGYKCLLYMSQSSERILSWMLHERTSINLMCADRIDLYVPSIYIHSRVFRAYKLTRVFIRESINLTKCTTLNQSDVFLCTP